MQSMRAVPHTCCSATAVPLRTVVLLPGEACQCVDDNILSVSDVAASCGVVVAQHGKGQGRSACRGDEATERADIGKGARFGADVSVGSGTAPKAIGQCAFFPSYRQRLNKSRAYAGVRMGPHMLKETNERLGTYEVVAREARPIGNRHMAGVYASTG